MRTTRRGLTISTLTAVLLLPAAAVIIAIGVGIGTKGSAARCGQVPSDFNGDGHADVAVGEPNRDVGAAAGAGALRVLYGSPQGVTVADNRYYDETSFPGLGPPAAGDAFGSQNVSGYFNSDCYADLAVAVRGQNSAVYVVYGSADGLVPSSARKFTGTRIEGQPGGTDGVGLALAAGDFNGDGHTDLAMGIPLARDPGGGAQGGGVGVLYGTPSGLSLTGKAFFTQASPGVPGVSESGDQFGRAVAAGDFNGDGMTDLAVGAPGKAMGAVVRGGTVTILPGSPAGLTGTGSTVWSPDTTGVPGVSEVGGGWGFSVAAGDITGDGRADLVVGAPSETVGGAVLAGTITFLAGSASGLTATGSQIWSQNSPGVPGDAETDDEFGYSLAIGDFNGDGHADVAVGVPFESLPACLPDSSQAEAFEAGSVDVLYGASTGLSSSQAQAWSQRASGLKGYCETADWFGFSLQALMVESTGHADLIIGVPSEDVFALNDGMIQPIYGGPAGLTSAGSQTISPFDLVGGEQLGGELSMTWYFGGRPNPD